MRRTGIAVGSLAPIGAIAAAVVLASGRIGARSHATAASHGLAHARLDAGPVKPGVPIVPRRDSSAIRQDLFYPLPPATKPAKPKLLVAAAKSVCAPPPDPLASLVYKGLVELNGRRMALVEDSNTKEGRYVAVGDDLEGFQVAALDRSALTVTPGGGARRLAMNEDFDVLPLDRDAGYLGGRETPHKAGSADELALAIDGKVRMLTANSLALNWNGEDVQKLQNDVFDGKITQQEFDQRTSGAHVQFLTLSEAAGQRWEVTGTAGQAVQLYFTNTATPITQGNATYQIETLDSGRSTIRLQVRPAAPAQPDTARPQRHLELPTTGRTYICGGPEEMAATA